MSRHEIDPALFKSKPVSEMTEEELKDYRNKVLVEEHTSAWLESQNPEVWTQTTSDGLLLKANYFPNKDSHKYAIVVHGWTSKKEHMYDYAAFFYDWGYNVLAPDNRAHGESEGIYIGMGWLDSQDHLNWINKIVQNDPDAQITMLGVSMGGATVMMLSGLDLPSNVKCLVEDCGYSSVWDVFSHNLKDLFHLNDWPVMYLSEEAAKRMCGYSLKEASSLERLKNAKVPMLFIHGTADTFVPYEMIDDNISAYKGPYKEVFRSQDATHGQALVKNPELYTKTVKEFCDRFISE